MKIKPEFKIIILEDDDFYNELLTSYLKRNLEELGEEKGFTVNINSYTSFMDCSRNLDPETVLLFTDYYLSDGFSAPFIMQKLKYKNMNCKVVVMSRIQSLQTSVSPMLDGAIDFIKKDSNALNNCLLVSEAILSEKLSNTANA